MASLKTKTLASALFVLVPVQLCSCDGPRVRLPVRESPPEPEPEPEPDDGGTSRCESSASCTDRERPVCSPTGDCVQCIEDTDCPGGECEHGACEESEEDS